MKTVTRHSPCRNNISQRYTRNGCVFLAERGVLCMLGKEHICIYYFCVLGSPLGYQEWNLQIIAWCPQESSVWCRRLDLGTSWGQGSEAAPTIFRSLHHQNSPHPIRSGRKLRGGGGGVELPVFSPGSYLGSSHLLLAPCAAWHLPAGTGHAPPPL